MKKFLGAFLSLTVVLSSLSILAASASGTGIKCSTANGYVDSSSFALHPANAHASKYTDTPSAAIAVDGGLQLNYFGDDGYFGPVQPFTGDFTCQFTLLNYDTPKSIDTWVGFTFGKPAVDSSFTKACMVIFDGTTNGFIGFNPGVTGIALADGSGRVWGGLKDQIRFDSRDNEKSDNSITLKYVWDSSAKTLTLYKKNSDETDFEAGKVWNMAPGADSQGYVGLCFTGETTLEVKNFMISASKAENALDGAVVTDKTIKTASQGASVVTASGTTDSSVSLTWNAMAGAASYVANVFDKDGNYIKSVSTTGTSVTADSLTKDTQYQIQVVGVDANKASVGYAAPVTVKAAAATTAATTAGTTAGTTNNTTAAQTNAATSSAGTSGNPKTSDALPVASLFILAASAAAIILMKKK